MSSTSPTVPVGQPLYGASFGQSVKRFFQGYVKFSGRASRSEFWWAMLFTFLITLLASVPYWFAFAAMMTTATAATMSPSSGTALAPDLGASTGMMLFALALMSIVSLAVLLPTYAVMWRRLQDANFHGAFMLLGFAGLGIVPLVMCAMPSNPAGVQYDPAYRAHAGAYGHASAPAAYYGSAPYGQPQPHGQHAAYGQHAAFGQPQAYGDASYGGLQYGGQPYGQPSSAPVEGRPPAEPRPQP